MLSIGKTHNSESQIQFTSKKRKKNHIYHFNGSLCEIDFNINKTIKSVVSITISTNLIKLNRCTSKKIKLSH